MKLSHDSRVTIRCDRQSNHVVMLLAVAASFGAKMLDHHLRDSLIDGPPAYGVVNKLAEQRERRQGLDVATAAETVC